jgi:cAMP-dependent protein kinase regulator
VFGVFNKKSIFAPKKITKSEEARLLILSLIRNSILFKNIDSNDEQTIIDAMGEQNCQVGETIISEGAAGDQLYIVESGDYDCFKNINGKETYLKTYKFGESFGELALMYNAPRAATIRVKTEGKLFTLDRQTFSQVVKNASSRRRALFQQILSKIELFEELDSCEK